LSPPSGPIFGNINESIIVSVLEKQAEERWIIWSVIGIRIHGVIISSPEDVSLINSNQIFAKVQNDLICHLFSFCHSLVFCCVYEYFCSRCLRTNSIAYTTRKSSKMENEIFECKGACIYLIWEITHYPTLKWFLCSRGSISDLQMFDCMKWLTDN